MPCVSDRGWDRVARHGYPRSVCRSVVSSITTTFVEGASLDYPTLSAQRTQYSVCQVFIGLSSKHKIYVLVAFTGCFPTSPQNSLFCPDGITCEEVSPRKGEQTCLDFTEFLFETWEACLVTASSLSPLLIIIIGGGVGIVGVVDGVALCWLGAKRWCYIILCCCC